MGMRHSWKLSDKSLAKIPFHWERRNIVSYILIVFKGSVAAVTSDHEQLVRELDGACSPEENVEVGKNICTLYDFHLALSVKKETSPSPTMWAPLQKLALSDPIEFPKRSNFPDGITQEECLSKSLGRSA